MQGQEPLPETDFCLLSLTIVWTFEPEPIPELEGQDSRCQKLTLRQTDGLSGIWQQTTEAGLWHLVSATSVVNIWPRETFTQQRNLVAQRWLLSIC